MSINILKKYDTSTKSYIGLGNIVNKVYFLNSKKSYLDYLHKLNKGNDYKVFGSLTNTLIRDSYNTDIIFYEKTKIYKNDIKIIGEIVEVNCGIKLSSLVRHLTKNGYDASHLYGIPGTIGGAIANNSGSGKEKKSIFDNLEKLIYYEKTNKIIKNKSNIIFSDRFTGFKNCKNILLYKCYLKFEKCNTQEIEEKISKRIEYRKKYNFINNYYTLGSLFINNGKINLVNEKIEGNFIYVRNKILNKCKSNDKGNIDDFVCFIDKLEEEYDLEKEIQIIDYSKYKKNTKYVGLIFVDKKGNILLQKRDNKININNTGMIGLFGGAINKNEKILEGLKREIKEELSFNVDIDKLKFINCFIKCNEKSLTECYIYKLQVEDIYIFKNNLQCNEGNIVITNTSYLESNTKIEDSEFTKITLKSISYLKSN